MGVFLLDDLDAFWNFEESSGSLVDEVGPYTASVNGVPIAYSQLGVNNNCIRLNFGGGSCYLNVPNTADLLYGDEDMTISCFALLYDESLGSGQIFGCWYGTTQRSYALFYSQTPNTYVFAVSPDGTQASSVSVTSSVTPVAFVSWYHILAQHDSVANQIEIRVTPRPNSNINAATVQAYSNGLWAANPRDFLIGRLDTAGPGYLKWNVDNLGIWRRKLNGDEIEALFDETPYSSFVSSTGGDTGADYNFYWGRDR